MSDDVDDRKRIRAEWLAAASGSESQIAHDEAFGRLVRHVTNPLPGAPDDWEPWDGTAWLPVFGNAAPRLILWEELDEGGDCD